MNKRLDPRHLYPLAIADLVALLRLAESSEYITTVFADEAEAQNIRNATRSELRDRIEHWFLLS